MLKDPASWSQPEIQTRTHPYNRTLFKCTGQGKKISTEDTCTYERRGLLFESASNIHCCLKQPHHTLPSRNWWSSALEDIPPLLLPPWGKAPSKHPTRNITLDKPCGFPAARSVPYLAGCGCNEGSNEGQRVVSVTLVNAAGKGTCSEGIWPRVQDMEEEVASTSEWARKIMEHSQPKAYE